VSWARLDDRFHGNPKVMRAWRSAPAAVGLYVMGITYCAQHETDGFIDEGFVMLLAPQPREQQKLTAALVQCGLWHEVAGGWTVNGYLDFNPSRQDLEEKRRKDAERKARGRHSESRQSPGGVPAESARPVPTRPLPDDKGSNPQEGSPLRTAGSSHLRALVGEAT
jgi:hypothetical protein